MKIRTEGLLSKWGFLDGNKFSEFLLENFREYINSHALLIVILKKYVIPQIKSKLEIVEISTAHNPVRTRSVDDVKVDWYDPGDSARIEIDPQYVEVPDEILLQEAQLILDSQKETISK